MSAITVALLLGFILSVSTVFYFTNRKPTQKGGGYILWNQVNHARLLPAESSHAFTYAIIALFVSLKSLENRSLDLGYGKIFGYGSIHGRLVGLRAKPYLINSEEKSIWRKLVGLLEQRGFISGSERVLEDAWMLTMPSYLGFEGINPLTVYFCYQPGDVLWLVILEVHNTFGESHVYVLEVGVNEDSVKSTSFDYQWTLPRAFHVSPFNDRAGFYTVSVRRPSPPLITVSGSSPLPVISIRLHTPSSDFSGPGPLKLTALLRATHSIPLTTPNLLKTLVKYPITLFLSLPRIFYHAWILHYKKRLDVYIRPEPYPITATTPASSGVRWQPIGLFEAYCRDLVHRFLETESSQLGIRVTVTSSDPTFPNVVFGPVSSNTVLNIRYHTTRFYTILFMSPSPVHAYLLGVRTEKLFEVSDEETFIRIFQVEETSVGRTLASMIQRLRCSQLPEKVRTFISAPRVHPMDDGWTSGIIVVLLLFLGWLEKRVFEVMNARVVLGDAPWEEWIRAEDVLTGDKDTIMKRRVGSSERGGEVGSVRRY